MCHHTCGGPFWPRQQCENRKSTFVETFRKWSRGCVDVIRGHNHAYMSRYYRRLTPRTWVKWLKCRHTCEAPCDHVCNVKNKDRLFWNFQAIISWLCRPDESPQMRAELCLSSQVELIKIAKNVTIFRLLKGPFWARQQCEEQKPTFFETFRQLCPGCVGLMRAHKHAQNSVSHHRLSHQDHHKRDHF